MSQRFGDTPTRTRCHNCGRIVVTEVAYKPTLKTHIIALILCILLCPYCCIPYCCNSCKTIKHYCPECGAYIATADDD